MFTKSVSSTSAPAAAGVRVEALKGVPDRREMWRSPDTHPLRMNAVIPTRFDLPVK
jgi:hypothetical protein